jgi:Protein of unknown function (DUF4242)
MLYAAKCYWPGVTATEVELVVARAAHTGSRAATDDVTYLGSLLFANDELVLCLFEGPSRTAVTRASEQAGIPTERVMDSIWLEAAARTSTWRSALTTKVRRGRRK